MRQIIRASDRAWMRLSIIMLMLSVSLPVVIVFRWPKFLRIFGLFSVVGSPGYLLLFIWEFLRYGKNKKVLVSALILAVATVVAWFSCVLWAYGKLQ